MIPLIHLFRGGFLTVILLWYSVSVWHTMDEYFREEFKKYLEREYEQNKYLKEDVVGKTDSSKDENVGPILSSTLREGLSTTAASFIKDKHGDRVRENQQHIQVKLKNLHDTPTSSCPEYGSNSTFKSANSKKHSRYP
jgi:hypothetical protein